MSEQQNFEEIDIMALLAKGYASFKRHIILFILLPLAGLGIALALAFSSPEKFSSSMMIETDLLTPNEAKFIVKELEKSDSIPGIGTQSDKKIVDLSFDIPENESSTNPAEVYLTITVTVKDPKIFPYLEQLFIDYLNGTDPVVRTRRKREVFYKNMIGKIDEEISSMERIKQQGDNKTIANYLSPADLYDKTVQLYEKRMGYEIQLQDLHSVRIVKGFQSLVKDARLAKPVVAIIGFIVGFLSVVVILFIKAFNKYYSSMTS